MNEEKNLQKGRRDKIQIFVVGGGGGINSYLKAARGQLVGGDPGLLQQDSDVLNDQLLGVDLL